MKFLFGILFIITCITTVTAQQTKSRFYLLPQVGFLNGDNSINWQGSIAAGIRKNSWSIGLGAGIDYYKVRTVPVFVDLRKEIGNKHRPFFTYLNIGADLAAPREYEYTSRIDWWWTTPKSNFTNGVYAEAGLGFTVYHRKKTAVLLSVGYSVKTITERYSETIYADFPPYGQAFTTERIFDYRFNRFVGKIGCRLW